jgi:eukaryotic-like serine/threonine-protein kinase
MIATLTSLHSLRTRPGHTNRSDGLSRTQPSSGRSLIDGVADPHSVTERSLPRVGSYLLGRQIGSGGTAVVYAGTNPENGQSAAIKLQRVAAGVGDMTGTILQNEVAILRHLEHPSVLPLLDHGQLADGRRWLAFPLMAAGDLHSLHLRLSEGKGLEDWPLRRRLTAFLSLCSAVEHAHAHGVVHRDLKPRNVMFDDDGFVHLADWGLAGPPTSPPSPDQPAPAAAGTPGYMSPEQITPRSGPVDARSDVWSLGVVLYETITLRRAVPGRTVMERMAATMTGGPRDPREAAPETPDGLAYAAMRAMEHRSDKRFESVLDLAIAVGAAVSTLPIGG